MRPDHIIIRKDGDLGHDFRNSSAHLAALVGLCNAQYANFTAVESSNSSFGSFYASIDGDNDDLERLCRQTRLDGAAEGFPFAFNGRDDDSDIFVGVEWRFGDGDGFICPIGNQVNNKAQITEDAADIGKHMTIELVWQTERLTKAKLQTTPSTTRA